MKKSRRNELLNRLIDGQGLFSDAKIGEITGKVALKKDTKTFPLLQQLGFDETTPVFLIEAGDYLGKTLEIGKDFYFTDLLEAPPFDNFVLEVANDQDDDRCFVICNCFESAGEANPYNIHLSRTAYLSEHAVELDRVVNVSFVQKEGDGVNSNYYNWENILKQGEDFGGNFSFSIEQMEDMAKKIGCPPPLSVDDFLENHQGALPNDLGELEWLHQLIACASFFDDYPLLQKQNELLALFYFLLNKEKKTMYQVSAPKLPPSAKKKNGKGKAYRLHQETDHIVIQAGGTKNVYIPANAKEITVKKSGSPKSPHNRRATMRHLKSGKVVPVRAAKVKGGGAGGKTYTFLVKDD